MQDSVLVGKDTELWMGNKSETKQKKKQNRTKKRDREKKADKKYENGAMC